MKTQGLPAGAMELASKVREALRQAVYVTRRIDLHLPDVSTSQLSLLVSLGADGARVTDIARSVGVRIPTATEQVNRLEARGLVAKASHPTDSRGVIVSLTEEGREVVDTANHRRNEAVAEAMRGLSEEEMMALETAIPVLAQIYNSVRVGSD